MMFMHRTCISYFIEVQNVKISVPLNCGLFINVLSNLDVWIFSQCTDVLYIIHFIINVMK